MTPSLATQRLAHALKAVRAREGLSQEALAKRWGCAQAQIGKLESMATDSPGVRWFEMLCDHFHVPWGYFRAAGPGALPLAEYIATHALETRVEQLEHALDQAQRRKPQSGERRKTDP